MLHLLLTVGLLGAGEADDARSFWAFRAPERHSLPDVGRDEWVLRPHDAFVLARLEAAGLSPGPGADRRTLARRLSHDLLGLPPGLEMIDAFVDDAAPLAVERLVDRLIASPAFGERWARPWLDLARFAEDQAHIVGNNASLFYPNAYLYRDWVIDALNADMPYDDFVREQLAADIIAPEDRGRHVALGFLGLGPKYYNRGSLEVKADEWEDRVDVVTRGLLGLTVACARCHDHKYDPISAEDYHGLAGVFASTSMFNAPLAKVEDGQAKKKTKKPADAMHIVREGKPTDLNVFVRGDVNNKGPRVPRRFLRALSDGEPEAFTKGSGRLELAEAIARRDNPLTARVIVNRVWGRLLGRPLVRTPSNFGALGERPTHPRLLDDLAVRFMDSGWSLKWLVREIVLSSTYRQTSRADADRIERDPDNTLLSRMARRRLGVEAWRDALLSASGRLDRRIGGASETPHEKSSRRRTLYARASRFKLDPMLALFDFPDPNVHAATRAETTTPLQKMFVLNNAFMIEQAMAVAERLEEVSADSGPGGEEALARRRIERSYELVLGRAPDPREVEIGLEFVAGASGPNPWRDYAHVLLASNELLFVD